MAILISVTSRVSARSSKFGFDRHSAFEGHCAHATVDGACKSGRAGVDGVTVGCGVEATSISGPSSRAVAAE